MELALPGVPERYLIPGFLSNTQDNQIFWPALADKGLLKLTFCQPAVPLTTVAVVDLSNVPGAPD